MNGATRNAVGFALAMCRDAYGNAMSGQPMRSYGFLAAATKVLTALQEFGEAKGDVRAEMKLQEVLKAAFVETEALPAFDNDKMANGMAEYQKLGLSPKGVLTSFNEDDLPQET